MTCEDCGNELELVPGKKEEYACRYCFGWLIATQRRQGQIKTQSPFDDQNLPFELPTWKGYTVDMRLRQFRKVTGSDRHGPIEFVEFDSVKGRTFLVEIRHYFFKLYKDEGQ